MDDPPKVEEQKISDHKQAVIIISKEYGLN